MEHSSEPCFILFPAIQQSATLPGDTVETHKSRELAGVRGLVMAVVPQPQACGSAGQTAGSFSELSVHCLDRGPFAVWVVIILHEDMGSRVLASGPGPCKQAGVLSCS